MCLIVHREPHQNRKKTPRIPSSVIEFNSRQNDDGFGIAWRENGFLSQKKFGPAEVGSFELLLKEIDKDPAIEYVAHFRTATTGAACVELSHPFSYDDPVVGQVLVFHNGVIDIVTDDKLKESDTSVFVERVLARIESCWWRNPAMRYLVGEAVGWSKLLIMTEFETVRLNEERWQEKEGIWYSTTPIFTTTVPVIYSGKGGYLSSSNTGANKKFDDHEEDDYIKDDTWRQKYRDSQYEKYGDEVPYIIPKDGWESEGHHCTPISPLYGDGEDETGDILCDVCNLVGEFWIIEGQVLIEMAHDPQILLHEQRDKLGLTN